MKKIFMLIVVSCILLFSCSNSNLRVDLSKGDTALVPGTKIYAGYDFSIWRIRINNVPYLVNSKGGIIKEF